MTETMRLGPPHEAMLDYIAQALAPRVADLIHKRHDDGFLNVDGASAYLSTTPKAIRRKVECSQIPHHRVGGRILFDKAELRAWVERGG